MGHDEELRRKIGQRSATVAVIGLGYVGLPLALAFTERGFPVIGLDVDPRKVEALRSGHSYLSHIASDRIRAAASETRFETSADFGALARADVVIICVPTPLTEAREPDLSCVEATARHIQAALRPGQLVVLESTTYPGTTSELLRPMLEQTGLTIGREVFLAFSPEREDPGNERFSTITIPKVVGGVDHASGDLAEQLYAQVVSKVVRVSSAAAAEATKITENVFRAVNIALVNELKMVFEHMDIDVWEVLDAAATKPFGFMRFNPGPGWGGHCIPLDPFYLAWRARKAGVDTRFIELAGEVNRGMSGYVVGRVQEALNDRSKAVKGSAILLVGFAYKRDVGDTRESPAYPIAQRLIALGAQLSYHDPYVGELPETRSWPEHPALRSVALTPENVARFDLVVIVTDHGVIDYELLHRHAALIVDTRGVYRAPSERVVRA